MKALDWFFHFIHRFRYPVSLPEEIAHDLGINITNFLTFDQFVCLLTDPSCKPRRLERFMSRDIAEAAFGSAQRKEKFSRSSLFSYYFHEGWLEFNLCFDEHARLRRVYLQHKQIIQERGIEIPLNQTKLVDQKMASKTSDLSAYTSSKKHMSPV